VAFPGVIEMEYSVPVGSGLITETGKRGVLQERFDLTPAAHYCN
jgi:hypothetical protein